MTTQYWLVKSEPASYAWADLVRDRRTAWTGVRNFAARLHLKAMRAGDRVLFYESVTTKAVVGIAEVTRAAFPDETAKQGDWVAVELTARETLARPVTLDEIKGEPALAGMTLLRIGRLSVQPVKRAEFERVVKMAKRVSRA
jgi:predicted RNA-binding protein with PUA-like domain